MEDYVHVDFFPPRPFRRVGKMYVLMDGTNELKLPMSKTTLVLDGELATGAEIPRFIAEDRGLTARASEEHNDMTRQDWFTLGITMALLIRGDSTRGATWNAGKVVATLLEGEL